MRAAKEEPAVEVLAARATVMLDARALDELGPATLDRLADLVAKRLAERRAAGELPLLTLTQAAEVAQVNPSTVRKAIHSGELEVVGFVGQRARLRRDDIERWLQRQAESRRSRSAPSARVLPPRRVVRPDRLPVLGDAIAALQSEGRS